MSAEHLLAFNIALLVAIASPGPAFLVAVRTAISNGRAAGIATGCGLAVMAASWTLMALVGLEGIFLLFPWSYTVVKTAGALYLLHIAWTTWRGATSPIADTSNPNAKAFRQGIIVNLSNPKSVLFAAAVLVVIFPQNMAGFEKALIVANHLVVELLCYTGLAFVMSTEAVRQRYLRAKTVLDRSAALVLGGLGFRLLFQRQE